jgi:hypothetical protein
VRRDLSTGRAARCMEPLSTRRASRGPGAPAKMTDYLKRWQGRTAYRGRSWQRCGQVSWRRPPELSPIPSLSHGLLIEADEALHPIHVLRKLGFIQLA